MSQAEDDSICLACDFLLRSNRYSGYSPLDDWDDLEGLLGPIQISISAFERELIHHRSRSGGQENPPCALFQLLLRAIELSFDRKVSAKYLKDDPAVLSLLKLENYFQSEKGAKTCKIRILDAEPPDRHRLAADFGEEKILSIYIANPSSPTIDGSDLCWCRLARYKRAQYAEENKSVDRKM
jgi:hypothetical protein